MKIDNQKIVFEEISKFVQSIINLLQKKYFVLRQRKDQDINDSSFKEITNLINLEDDEPSEFDWLVDTTEKWCRDRAIY